MYSCNFISHDIAEYYLGNELLFSSKRKTLFLRIGSETCIFDKDKMIFSFYDFDFSFFYWKLKILSQDLNEKAVRENSVYRRYRRSSR